jgi:hypothetical protein
MGWLLPVFASWTRWVHTEILHTFGLLAFCCVVLLACRAPRNRQVLLWAAAGVVGGLTLLIRIDVLYVFLPVAGLWGLLTAPDLRLGRRVALFAVYAGAACLVLVPWCIRDYLVFGEYQLPGVKQYSSIEPYGQWVSTWLDDPQLLEPYGWYRNHPDGPTDFPPDLVPDAGERQRARQALLRGRQLTPRNGDYPPDVQAVFTSLVDEARERRPWHYQLRIALKRTALTWLDLGFPHGRLSWPGHPLLQALLKGSWLVVLVSAMVGIGFAVVRRRADLLLLAGLIASRTALPFVSGWMADCRYLVQALPAVYLFAALGMVMVYERLRVAIASLAGTAHAPADKVAAGVG